MINFFIAGTPAPQGSKTGRVVNGRVVMWEASNKVGAWRTAIKTNTPQVHTPYTTPLEVSLVFTLEKPKSVTRKWPAVKPDLDKLIRSTFDGLTDSGIWADDALVIAVTATKRYGDETGVHVGIWEEGSHV